MLVSIATRLSSRLLTFSQVKSLISVWGKSKNTRRLSKASRRPIVASLCRVTSSPLVSFNMDGCLKSHAYGMYLLCLSLMVARTTRPFFTLMTTAYVFFSLYILRTCKLRTRTIASYSISLKSYCYRSYKCTFIHAEPSPRNLVFTARPFSPTACTTCGSPGTRSMAWSLNFTSSPSTLSTIPFTGFFVDSVTDSPSWATSAFKPTSSRAGKSMNLNGSGLS